MSSFIVTKTVEPTLFFRLKSKPPVEESRASLYAEPLALRTEICSLGVLDSFIELKQLLKRALTNPAIFVPPELNDDLTNLIRRIQPLRQFIFDAAKAKKDILEMQKYIENIQKQLHPVKTQKLTHLLANLAELYRNAQRELEKDPATLSEKYDCCLIGFTTGYRYIPKSAQRQLMPMDDNGNCLLNQKIGAMRPVHHFGHLFWKLLTETTMTSAPLAEKVYYLLGAIVCRHSSAPTDVQKLIARIENKDHAVIVQASKEVENGISMRVMLEKYPDWLSKLDPEEFGLGAILDMLALPHDAKEDNVFVIPTFDGEGRLIKVRIKVIDADLWGAHPVYQHKGDYFVGVRSIFFCLPQMYTPIHPKVRQQFLEDNPTVSVLQWLLKIGELNLKATDFAREGHIQSDVMEELQMPFYLLSDFVPTLHEKLVRIRNFMRDAPENAKYMDLFLRIVPELASYYDLINQSFEGNPHAAFHHVFVGNTFPYKEVMKPLMEEKLVGNIPLKKYLEQCPGEDFETRRDTSPENASELLLQQYDFSTQEPKEQLAILNIIKHSPLTELTIRNCEVLTDDDANALIRAMPRLSQLTLIGCHALTPKALQACADYNSHLEITISDCSGISPEALSELRVLVPSIASRDRRDTILIESELFQKETSSAAEEALFKLSAALDASDWPRVKGMLPDLEKKDLLARAKTKIVEKLISKDAMRLIVKNHRLDALEIIFSIGIPLFQKNAQGDTFFHHCCAEGNEEMLDWLCKKSPEWREIVDQKGLTPCHVASQLGNKGCLSILVKAKAPFTLRDKSDRTPLRLALEAKQIDTAFELLNTEGTDLTETDVKGNTLLHAACQFGLEEVVERLIKNAPQLIDQPNKAGRVPLHCAAEANQVKCCRQLMRHMKSVEIFDKEGLTPAQVAARAGAHDCMILLLGDKPVKSVTKDGKTMLHLAAIAGNAASVEWLLKKGLALTALDERKMSPAHYAAATGQGAILDKLLDAGFKDIPETETLLMQALRSHQYLIVDKLLKRGAALVFDKQGLHPIHIAAKESDNDLLRYLCNQLKIDVNLATQDQRKCPPLFIAAAEGHEEATRTLLALKANINAPDRQGKRALHQAMLKGFDNVARLLILEGADVDLVMSDGASCAHYAAANSHPALLETALDKHAKLVNRKTEVQGHTPLHQAMLQRDLLNCPPDQIERTRRKQKEVVLTLLRHEAAVNAIDNYGYTPLHLAVRSGRADLAKILLDYGADPTMRNKDGRTPEQLGDHFAKTTTNEKMQEAIKDAIELLHGHGKLTTSKKIVPTIYGRSTSRIMPQTFEDGLERLWKSLEEMKGFHENTIRQMSSLLAQLHDLPEAEKKKELFDIKLESILKAWGQKLPKPLGSHRFTLALEEGITPQQLSLLCMQNNSDAQLDELALAITLYSSLLYVLQEILKLLNAKPPISDSNLKALCKLFLHLQKHEALNPEDFPSKICSDIIKRLEKLQKGNEQQIQTFKEFLKHPQKQFTTDHIGAQEHEQKLFSLLSDLFDHPTQNEKETAIEALSLSLMKAHEELFQKLRISDFRPLAPALNELDKCSDLLTINCMKLLLSAEDVKHMTRRLDCIILWIGKSLMLGDYHQAFSLYQALKTRVILRVDRARKHLSDQSKQQLNQFEKLFLPSSHYQTYFSHLDQRLTPVIPSITIYRELPLTYSLWRHIHEHRIYAKRLILQTPQHFSAHMLLISQDLFPQMQEGDLWNKSLKLQPPK